LSSKQMHSASAWQRHRSWPRPNGTHIWTGCTKSILYLGSTAMRAMAPRPIWRHSGCTALARSIGRPSLRWLKSMSEPAESPSEKRQLWTTCDRLITMGDGKKLFSSSIGGCKMNIHEYQGKQILRDYGVVVPNGIVAFSP